MSFFFSPKEIFNYTIAPYYYTCVSIPLLYEKDLHVYSFDTITMEMYRIFSIKQMGEVLKRYSNIDWLQRQNQELFFYSLSDFLHTFTDLLICMFIHVHSSAFNKNHSQSKVDFSLSLHILYGIPWISETMQTHAAWTLICFYLDEGENLMTQINKNIEFLQDENY